MFGRFNSFGLKQVRAGLLASFLALTPVVFSGEDAPPPAPAAVKPAQPAPAAPKPPLLSPEFLPDGSIVFRLAAPKAAQVLLEAEWSGGKKIALTKDAQGLWSVTVTPPPELYQYKFNVDGASVPDPGNMFVKPGRTPASLVNVPAPEPRLFDRRPDVPRGAVVEHRYYSKTLEMERRLRVYVPPGALASRAKLPVLFLLHGSTDCEASWTAQGCADTIADNLLAAGRMKPMLIVMPDGHAEAGASSRVPAERSKMYERFEADLLKEVLPLVEREYPVESGPAHRALVGLSMGGAQTLHVGLRNPETFHWLGVYSQGILDPETDLFVKQEALRKDLRWFWIGMGRADSRAARATEFSALLTARQIPHKLEITDGGHTWQLWRKYLAQTLPELFK